MNKFIASGFKPNFCKFVNGFIKMALFYIVAFNRIYSSLPWLVWLSGLSAGLGTKGSLVRFPVWAHACVRYPAGGTQEATTH